jgi:hypothetical protein
MRRTRKIAYGVSSLPDVVSIMMNNAGIGALRPAEQRRQRGPHSD